MIASHSDLHTVRVSLKSVVRTLLGQCHLKSHKEAKILILCANMHECVREAYETTVRVFLVLSPN